MTNVPNQFSVSRGGTFNRPRDWPALERLTRDLFARLLGDFETDLHGRTGQPQAGVDVDGVDRRSGKRYGIQCKGRNDACIGHGRPLTERELREEVEKALSFEPPLDHFIVLTTGPNDEALQRVARELDAASRKRGGFGVAFHGWDWVEGHLAEHVDLAAGYGLIAVSQPRATSIPVSPIGGEIGSRLQRAIAMMNAARDNGEAFTLQGLARHAGHKDWRRLEQIVAGTADADVAEIIVLAEALGLSSEWLVEGKGAPFCLDLDVGHKEVEQVHHEIMALQPERVVFVRHREGGHGHHDTFIVVQRGAVRWFVFRDTHPASGKVGSGGARQMFDLCRLFRRLDHARAGNRVTLSGLHLDSPHFEQLLEGEVYPGTILRIGTNDLWWQDLSSLRADWVDGDEPHQAALREAIEIVKDQLERARKSAPDYEWRRLALAWGHFDVKPTKPVDGKI